METLAAVLVATVITSAIGIVVGDPVAARSRPGPRMIGPILDAAQMMPAFVYLVPVVALFGADPVHRHRRRGGVRGAGRHQARRRRDPQGPHRRRSRRPVGRLDHAQVISKVQLPMARRALMLATNQGVLRARDGGDRRPGRRVARWATTSSPASRRRASSARAWRQASPSCCSASCSTGSPRRPARAGRQRQRGADAARTARHRAGTPVAGRPIVRRRRRGDRRRGASAAMNRAGAARLLAVSPSRWPRSSAAALRRQRRGVGTSAAACGTVNIADQPVGRLRGERRRRRRPARDELGCKVDEKDLTRRSPGRASAPARSTSSSRTGATPDLEKKYIDGPEGRRRRRPDRQQGHHRLVRAAVDGREVPGHHRLEQPQQVRRPVQDLRVRRQGPVPRRRPGLRHQRRGAGQEPRT